MSFSMPPMSPEEEARRREEEAALAHRRRYDELIAVVVALAGIGGVLWWGSSQNYPGFNLTSSLALNGSSNGATPGNAVPSFFGTAPTASSRAIAPTAPNGGTPQKGRPGAAPTEDGNGVGRPAPTQGFATAPSGTNPPSPQAMAPAAGTLTPPAGAGGSTETPNPAATTNPPPTSSASPTPAATDTPKAQAPTPKATISFTDVPSDYWAEPYIQELGKRGILEGSGGNFLPDKPVTRAEFASMLQKAFFDRPPVRDTMSFKDVLPGYWGLPAIDEAVKLGFMNGYTDGNFRATKQIPKLEGVVALVSGLKLPDGAALDLTQVFQDGGQVPQWATGKIGTAVQSSMVVNHPEPALFNPSQPLTRADAAALIYQALAKDGKVPAIDSNYLAKP
jgi:hypothetical protein